MPKYFRNRLGVLAQAVSVSRKITPSFVQFFLQGVVDHLGLVLRAHAGQELALGLGDAQPVEGVLDVVGHVVPVFPCFSVGLM